MAGRPRSFDRDAALAAAVEQFWRAGYDGASIASLTKAMGVTPPSLYAAFGDKKQLFEEAAAAYYSRTCEGLDVAMALPTARESVERMLLDTARAHTATDHPPGCMMLTEPRLEPQRDDVHRRLRDRLDRGVRDGDLDPESSTDAVASFLVAVMRGMSGRAQDGGTFEELEAIVNTAMATFPPPPDA